MHQTHLAWAELECASQIERRVSVRSEGAMGGGAAAQEFDPRRVGRFEEMRTLCDPLGRGAPGRK